MSIQYSNTSVELKTETSIEEIKPGFTEKLGFKYRDKSEILALFENIRLLQFSCFDTTR